MGFKNMKRDDHGHVISNDETDGQECKHASGQADKVEDQKYNKEMKEAQEQNALMSDAFDDDYEEEFEDSDYRASRLVADLKSFDWADESLVNRMNNILNYKNYRVGTLENNIAINLEEGMSDKEAVEDAIYGMEVYGDQPPEDEDDDDLYIPTDEEVQQIKDEHAPDEEEMNAINKQLEERNAREKQVQHFVNKAKELKKQGKMSDIWNMLRGLDDDTANRVLEELMGK